MRILLSLFTIAILTQLNAQIDSSLFDNEESISKDRFYKSWSSNQKFTNTQLGLGLGAYGFLVPAMKDLEIEQEIGVYMLSAASSIAVPLLLTKGHEITEPMANLNRYGSTRGFLKGLAYTKLVDFNGENDYEPSAKHLLLGSLTEGVVLYEFARRTEVTEGTSKLMRMYGDLTYLYSTSLYAYTETSEEAFARGILFAPIVGMAVGYIQGNAFDYTEGQAKIIGATSLFGSMIPMAFAGFGDETSEDYEKSIVVSGIVGNLAGLAIGHFLAEYQDVTSREGSYITLGTLAGGLFGTGMAWLLTSNDESLSAQNALIGLAAGGALGFNTLYNRFKTTTPSFGGLRY